MTQQRHKHTICIANHLAEPVIEYLKEQVNLITWYDGYTWQYLHDSIPKSDALIVRSATRVTEKMLQAGKSGKLKIVGTATAGVDHIDLWAAERLAITIVNSPWGNSLANAEFIIGMMIALSRNIIRCDSHLRKGVWNQELGIGPELAGKTFGTIGFGKIGGLAAEKARLLGMNVLAYDPYAPTDSFAAKGVRRVDLKELLERADFLSLSIPFHKDTNKLIGAEELKLLKPNCFIIQSSRGGIIDEDALIVALKNKIIAGASLDVFRDEPNIREEFKQLDNTILTPHIGCSSQESRIRSGMSVANDILRVLRGENPIHEVTAVSEHNFHKLLG